MTDQDDSRSLSATLAATARSLTAEKVSLGHLLDAIGEDGLLMVCIILMVPFLFPVSVPGVSTVFSVVVMYTVLGIMLNRRKTRLPQRIVDRTFGTKKLVPSLLRASRLFARLDRMCRPRMPSVTGPGAVMRINGFMILLGGVLLIFPLGGVPLSNTLPALGVLFVAAGMTRADGLFVLIGYGWVILSIVYFVVLALLVIQAGKGLTEYFGALLLLLSVTRP